MIVIKNFKHAKKITQFLFERVNKNKITLNSFRQIFSSAFGFKSLEDAFRKENKERLNEAKNNVITYLDDPRITIEVARLIKDDEKIAEQYFNENLKDNTDILFPVRNPVELLQRVEEILILWHEAEWFNRTNLINLLIKMSMPDSIKYEFNGKENANPELLFALQIIGRDNKFRNLHKLITNHIDVFEDEMGHEDGFYTARKEIRLFLAGVIWTQTNVGRSYHSEVIEEYEAINKRNLQSYEEQLENQ